MTTVRSYGYYFEDIYNIIYATVFLICNYLQIITGSHDSTIRLWDLAAGKTKVTLTNHKKSVRAVTLHPTQ